MPIDLFSDHWARPSNRKGGVADLGRGVHIDGCTVNRATIRRESKTEFAEKACTLSGEREKLAGAIRGLY
jgi:hypothetical protein